MSSCERDKYVKYGGIEATCDELNVMFNTVCDVNNEVHFRRPVLVH